jgi:hypothetical protein
MLLEKRAGTTIGKDVSVHKVEEHLILILWNVILTGPTIGCRRQTSKIPI